MRRMRLTTAFVALSVAIAGGLIRSEAQPQAVPAHDYPVQPVPFTAVHVTDQFWAPRIETNRTVTIPFAFGKNEETGRVGQLPARRGGAAGTSAGRHQAARLSVRRHRHLQGDRRRQLHAERPARSEALRLCRRPDREDRRGAGEGRLPLHDAHDRPAASASLGRRRALGQRDRRQPRALQPRAPLRSRRRALPGDREAHAARRRASHGRPARRDLRSRQADDLAGPPDHRDGAREAVSRDRERAVSRRSRSSCSTSAARAACRERRQTRTTSRRSAWSIRPRRSGHAVRAMYMYSGMADVAALTGDQSYVHAIDRIWDNVVERKLYLTGGIGARDEGEAFGDDYELPNMTRLQRDLRLGRQRLLEPAPVPAARRRPLHRRDGADALQRADLRRLARRQDVLLPEPARVERPARSAAPGSAWPAAPATSRGSWRRCRATSTRGGATRCTSICSSAARPTSPWTPVTCA